MSSPKGEEVTKIVSTQIQDIDPETFVANYSVVRLCLHGFATKAIEDRTGLSKSQVQMRIKMYGLQGTRRKFRNGETREASVVMDFAMTRSAKQRESDSKRYENTRQRVLKALREKGKIL